MANYTVTLADIIGSGVYEDEIFPQYELYTSATCEDRSAILEEKIITNYFQREIGYETIEAFLQRFHTVFKNFLPKYNAILQILDTEEKFTPYTRRSEKEFEHHNTETPNITNTLKGEEDYTGDSNRRENNTPYENYPDGTNYASFTENGSISNKRETDNTRTETGTRKDDGTSTQISKHIDDAYMTIVKRFVENFVDADMLFVEQFSKLFLMIY